MNCKNYEFWLVTREVNKALQMCSSPSLSEYQKPDRKEFDDMKERSQFRPVNFNLKMLNSITDRSAVESNVEMAEADVEDSNSTQYKEIER